MGWRRVEHEDEEQAQSLQAWRHDLRPARVHGEAPMRAAIYARMSTDKQADTSPEDQISRCREYAAGQGWHVVDELVVAERGISGASRHNRPGLLGLIERIGEWDVLVAFDFARLARNQEDLGWIRNRVRSQRKLAVEASTGLDSENVGAGFMGVVAEQYLEKVRQDTHRGLRGAFERKHATGGSPFGYRTEPIITGQDAHGFPITSGYRFEIDPEEAPIVARLFEGYARQGLGLRTLAHYLNREKLRSPRGNGWSPTAIREILRNPIYRAERIWNRSYWVKDHESGRRRRFERPEHEWVRQQDEAWRIVSDELWYAAQDARGRRNERHQRDGRGRIVRTALHGPASRKRMLSGFLVCGECGGSYHAVSGSAAWGCSWRRNRGSEVCTNTTRISQARLETAVMAAVSEALDEEVAARALEVALDELRKRMAAAEPTHLEAQLADLDAKIARALDLAIEHGDLAAAKDRLRDLKAERERVARQNAQARMTLPSSEELMPLLREKLHDIEATLRADVANGRLALGALLGDRRIRVYGDGRIEGALEVVAETLRAPKRLSDDSGARRLGGSGGGI
jgi:site-specific DNA recombinase